MEDCRRATMLQPNDGKGRGRWDREDITRVEFVANYVVRRFCEQLILSLFYVVVVFLLLTESDTTQLMDLTDSPQLWC